MYILTCQKRLTPQLFCSHRDPGLPGISSHAAWQHQLAPWGHVGHHLRAPFFGAVMGFLCRISSIDTKVCLKMLGIFPMK